MYQGYRMTSYCNLVSTHYTGKVRISYMISVPILCLYDVVISNNNTSNKRLYDALLTCVFYIKISTTTTEVRSVLDSRSCILLEASLGHLFRVEWREETGFQLPIAWMVQSRHSRLKTQHVSSVTRGFDDDDRGAIGTRFPIREKDPVSCTYDDDRGAIGTGFPICEKDPVQ